MFHGLSPTRINHVCSTLHLTALPPMSSGQTGHEWVQRPGYEASTRCLSVSLSCWQGHSKKISSQKSIEK